MQESTYKGIIIEFYTHAPIAGIAIATFGILEECGTRAIVLAADFVFSWHYFVVVYKSLI